MRKNTLYVGLNDKDAYIQLIDTEQAIQTALELSLDYLDGVTITTAKGTYTHENGKQVIENTLVITIYDGDENGVNAYCKALAHEFNQEAIINEETDINSKYITF